MKDLLQKNLRAIISVCLILIPGLLFGIFGRPIEMGIAVTAGALGAAFLNLSALESFKGGGFEAKMRQAINDVYATEKSVRELATSLICTTLDILTTANRFNSHSSQQTKHDYVLKLEDVASELSIGDSEDVLSALDKFYNYHAGDLYMDFTYHFQGAELHQYLDRENGVLPDESSIRKNVEELSLKITPEAEEALQDYLHYLQTRELRRPETLSKG